jgi:hypothetical protein
MRATSVVAIVAICCALRATIAGAQAVRPKDPYPVPRATAEITVDGVIEEKAWDDALMLELRYEVSPGENTEPPVRTVVFISYDERRVLVAFKAYDPEPDKIRARYRDRDHIFGDDFVGVTLDTFNDERRAYEFQVNPVGVQGDGIYNDVEHDYDPAWDAIWESAGRLTDAGYEVELAIPFNQIRFQPTSGPQIWGLDLTRSWPRSHRVHIGLFPRDRGANSYLAQEEKIIGFEGASAGRNLELVPTLTGYALQERPDFPESTEVSEDQELALGATVTWGITPNITVTGAINPDFSQIEADAVQLALNERFELFFDEKRPFFLESADYFETGLQLLYTRMIADPLFAAKLTGKVGRHTIGVIAARDEVTNLIVPGVDGSDSSTFDAPNTSAVGRYRFDLGADSTVGAFLTDRRGEAGYSNRVASADARLRPTDADSISVNAAWSSTQYSPEMQNDLDLDPEEISGHALELEYLRSTRNWFIFAEYSDVDDHFRADLGFIPRVGFRQADIGSGYIWWGDQGSFYNRFEVGAFASRTEDTDGGLLAQRTSAWLEYEGPLQTEVEVRLASRDEVYEGVRFANLIVPVFEFRMRPSAAFAFRLDGAVGDWIDYDNLRPADRTRISARIEINLGRHLELELSHLYSVLDVEGGRLFEANVPEFGAVWQFNTRTFVRAIVQYTDIVRNQDLYEDVVDELERDFFVQLLFSYKLNPRTVFFAGYSEGGAQTQDTDLTTIGRAIFLKIGYSWMW